MTGGGTNRPERSTKFTENQVAELLRERYAKNSGNGPDYVFMTQVRNAAGYDAKRTFDAVAVSCWPSRGLHIEVIEIKVSRSDWLAELKKPAKAEAAHEVADYFTVCAPSGIVKKSELPDGWGLIEVLGDGEDKPYRLRQSFHPGRIERSSSDIARTFMIPLLKAAAAPARADQNRIDQEAYRRGFDDGKDAEARSGKWAYERSLEDASKWKHLLAVLTDHGVSTWNATPEHVAASIAEIEATHNAVEDIRRLERIVTRISEDLKVFNKVMT